LELELFDASGTLIKRRDLRIYARDIPLSQQNIVTKVEHSQDSQFPFILVNGIRFKPLVFDQNGEVRYSLQIRTNRMGMLSLGNGKFLYADTTVNRAGRGKAPMACQYHEMDYMGRVYRTYLLDYPVGNLVAQKGDSLFLLTSSEEKYLCDCIVELDRNTGQIVKRCPLAGVLGEKYQNRRNWAVVSGLELVEGQMLITMRRLHTVLSLDWESLSVNWVLAPDAVWKGTPLEGSLLRSKDTEEIDGYMPERPFVKPLGDGVWQLAVYCIQNKGNVAVPGAVSDDDSRIDFYRVDTKTKTFEKQRSVAVVKSKRNGSCIYREESGRMLSLSGFLMRRSENLRACVEELDASNGRMINRLRLCRVYRGAWVFEPDIPAYSVPLAENVQTVLGSLTPPEPFSGTLPEESPEKLKKKIFGNVRVSDRIFLFAFRPGTVQKVYLVGQEHSYVQDFSRLKKRLRKMSFSIALEQLECDEYQVYVEYNDQVYHLKNEIRVEWSKKKK
jgi:hypothetical protein